MRTMPISVVMSVYNGARYLRASVESILAQTFTDFEFIIVNDGSTDGSRGILAEYERQDSRIRVIDQENTGLTKALIRGCAEARGRYIARQDADDISLPGRLERLKAMLNGNPALAVAASCAYGLASAGELICEWRGSSDPVEATYELLSLKKGPFHGAVMFRKDAYERVGGYRQQFYCAQDSDLWLRLGEVGLIVYSPAFLYGFRYDPATVSSPRRRAQRKLADFSHACRAARLAGEDESPLLEEASRIRPPFGTATACDYSRGLQFIGACLLKRRDARASHYFWEAVRRRPWSHGAWWGLARSAAPRGGCPGQDVTIDGVVDATSPAKHEAGRGASASVQTE